MVSSVVVSADLQYLAGLNRQKWLSSKSPQNFKVWSCYLDIAYFLSEEGFNCDVDAFVATMTSLISTPENPIIVEIGKEGYMGTNLVTANLPAAKPFQFLLSLVLMDGNPHPLVMLTGASLSLFIKNVTNKEDDGMSFDNALLIGFSYNDASQWMGILDATEEIDGKTTLLKPSTFMLAFRDDLKHAFRRGLHLCNIALDVERVRG